MAEVRAKRVRITFEDQPELEIIARSVPLAVLMKVQGDAVELAGAIERGELVDRDTVRRGADLGLAEFAAAIESWNLEMNGEPVPISVDGLLSLPDPTLVQQAVAAWRDALTKVPEQSPLPKPSNGGAPSPGVSIPMEAL